MSGFFRMGTLHLNYARTLVNEKKLWDCLCREMAAMELIYFSGEWSEIKAFKVVMVEAGLKDGLYFYGGGYLLFYTSAEIYRGNFDKVEELWENSAVNLEKYQYLYGWIGLYLVNTELLIMQRKLGPTLAEVKKLISTSFEQGVENHEIQGLGWQAVIQFSGWRYL